MSGLCAIACYFNPQGYERRRQNYHRFRKHLAVPLVTVELGFSGRFDLARQDADILVQIPGRDVMWQKECLLNIAARHVPAEFDAIAWLDCDVVFEREDWAASAVRALETHPLVQLFSHAYYMGRNWAPGLDAEEHVERKRPSMGSALSSGVCISDVLSPVSADMRSNAYTGGLAWAIRRELLEKHWLYDANILGGGDRTLAGAALGAISYTTDWNGFSERHADHFKSWANAFFSDLTGAVSGIPGRIYHLWHGDLVNRGYGIRHRILQEHDFDPRTDIKKNSLGVWEWASNKPVLHHRVADYFAHRKEDG